ncbi:hypothetical protein A3D77_01235 [Candidatus Gottesmanbacteria bacterium RIFCSPHIGHO2_02_FULL_39_11]|uniref:DUF458 domain-containing protein n=1 Tax=Candidatus Gottesmanbacteria bacterium RIFCSPHIGHO2_02_FULL_39_11 TaxID=1798382 RepID=A0A1F5ZTE0_9BACT|nr:MAG: hypothetical protein A3D77_01235 [Candidatus Gottesmanbacteria bacterium RIFCSPHIGHO2_02_FULL_39_11]
MKRKNIFISPTLGEVTTGELRNRILSFMGEDPDSRYKMIIGSDSQDKNSEGIDFVTAIVIHRLGFGGIYFWKRIHESKSLAMKSRIYQEATFSILCAQEIKEIFKSDDIASYELEIHVDIGNVGKTKEMINEVIGMVRGSGFPVRMKPYSYAASTIADRYT